MTRDETYKRLDHKQHVLERPDTYVGSVDAVRCDQYVLNEDKTRIVQRSLDYCPALYKIFDEIITNAADNKVRDSAMSKIEIKVNVEKKYIAVMNDGATLPITFHEEEQMYVPELVFGNLLTGSNFDDTQERLTGGRNGYGAKLTNIFSRKFVVQVSTSFHIDPCIHTSIKRHVHE